MDESDSENILVVGGYGLVGSTFCNFVRKMHGNVNIYIASHDVDKANRFAQELNTRYESSKHRGKCYGVLVNAKKENPLENIDKINVAFSALISLLKEHDNFLLADACKRGIPYLDITKGGEVMTNAMKIVDDQISNGNQVRVLWASEFFAAVPSLIAVSLARKYEQVDSVDIIALTKTKDKTGPDSVESLATLTKPFSSWEDGRYVIANSFSEYIPVIYPEGFNGYAYNTINVESLALPKIMQVDNVKLYLAVDDNISLPVLKILYKMGLLGLLGHPSLSNFRRKYLYSPQPGAPADVIVRVKGKVNKSDNDSQISECRLHGDNGGWHFTAVGTFIAFEYFMGLNGYKKPPVGNSFASWNSDIDHAIETIKELGIDFVSSQQ